MITYYKLRGGNVAMKNGSSISGYAHASSNGWVKNAGLMHTIDIDGDAEEIKGQEAKKLLASLYPGVKFFQ